MLTDGSNVVSFGRICHNGAAHVDQDQKNSEEGKKSAGDPFWWGYETDPWH